MYSRRLRTSDGVEELDSIEDGVVYAATPHPETQELPCPLGSLRVSRMKRMERAFGMLYCAGCGSASRECCGWKAVRAFDSEEQTEFLVTYCARCAGKESVRVRRMDVRKTDTLDREPGDQEG